jgi:hypothetical protein
MDYPTEVQLANLQSVINGFVIDIQIITAKIEQTQKIIDDIKNKYNEDK